MQGMHLTADLFDCTAPSSAMTDLASMRAECTQLAERAGLTVVGVCFHAFPARDQGPGGLTGALLLAESHLTIHTWPELRAATLDVFVCNLSTDNTPKAEWLIARLIERFAPGRCVQQRLVRGLPA